MPDEPDTSPSAGLPGSGGRPSGEAVSAGVADVWERMRDTVLARVDVLDDAVAALLERRLGEPERAEAERTAHKLAGSAGTFGFDEASRLARELEHCLAACVAGGDHDPWQAAEDVVALRQALEHEQSATGRDARGGGEQPDAVLLLTEDERLAHQLQLAGSSRGLDVLTAEGSREARRTLAQSAPAAVVVDGSLRGGCPEAPQPAGTPTSTAELNARSAPALAAVHELGRAGELPTVLLTEAEEQVDRVAAARVGVNGFLSRRLEADGVADALVERLRAVPVERVLACDDDPAVLETVRGVLEPSGLRVRLETDPRRFWEVLLAESPDLVLLDVDMPHVDGLELCRILRHDPTFTTLPVMFLTGHHDRGLVQRAFDTGADDVVVKPVLAAELQARVRSRLDRSRLLRRMVENDALTGLHNRRASLTALDRLISLARRHQQPMCLAVLDIDRFKDVNDSHGHAAGDAVLRELGRKLRAAFRTGDVAARWGGDELVVGMYGMGRHDGVQRLAEVLEELRDTDFDGEGCVFTASFSGGVAEHPADGGTVDELYRAADEALRLAKRAGGDQVHALDRVDDGLPGGYDVAVVEDDAATSELLTQALRTRGYEVVVIDDGDEARRRLVGDPAELQARVILLDVDLPGISGLDFLRELRPRQLLGGPRVVMLTAASAEQEVAEALQLGAFDHVAKPFSVPVLLERVRRALAA